MKNDKITKEIKEPAYVLQNLLASGIGLDKYERILKMYLEVNVSQDETFQKLFNSFYVIRMDKTWRNKYYTLFEEVKNSKPTFDYIINELLKLTGRVEASFSSKILATICPDEPILDQFVMKFLGEKISSDGSKGKRVEEAIKVYHNIEEWYLNYLKTENAKQCIRIFDTTFTNYTWLSETKKIDFYLWSIRD